MKYVSTLAIDSNEEEFFEEFSKSNIGVEFSSGGLGHVTSSNIEKFQMFQGKKIVHNYFPCYDKDPFVLNLASQETNTRKRSIAHAKLCIDLTSENSFEKFYAIHAGFNYELKVKDLGNKIESLVLLNQKEYFNSFIDSLLEINEYAKVKQVKLLVENNVLIRENFKNQKIPFQCVEADGISEIFNSLNDINIGLLLDTAHLKVSCKTLGKDPLKELKKIAPYIKAIHHSDNDGYYDTNSPITENYWFNPFLRDFRNLPQVLEVKKQKLKNIYEQLNILDV